MTAASAPREVKKASASTNEVVPDVPARTGTPHRSARARPSALSPKRASVSAGGPKNPTAAGVAAATKAGFLARKPVAGVKKTPPSPPRDSHDLLDIEMGGGPRTRKRPCLARPPHVQRRGIVVGVHRHGAHPEL